jgi:peptidoglycan/xylan/chitin deacetylase (PgdA/CDA1 family)
MQVATVWDDGLTSDFFLMAVLSKYGADASFALSPGVYKDRPTLNDHRSDEYGYRVTRDELEHYAPYDVCNHTYSHAQLDLLTADATFFEIDDGRKALEDIFQRPILGLVYPFGIGTPAARVAAQSGGHVYGRATPTARRSGGWACWDLVPTATWRVDVELLIESDWPFILLSGHTYEIRTREDQERVINLYRVLATAPEVKLITMSTLAKEIADAGSEGESQIRL